jgi:hypothetical protein
MPAMPEKVEHHHLLRAMDALMDHADRVESELAKQIRPLADRNVTVVFYDLTTVRIHGEGEVEEDLRAYGMNKGTGGIARQFVMGERHRHARDSSVHPNSSKAAIQVRPAQ